MAYFKETYNYRKSDSEYFEANYKKFLDSNFINDIDFIDDFMKSCDFNEVERIINKSHGYNPKKEKEFIDYVSKRNEYYDLVEFRSYQLFKGYSQIENELSYARSIVYFVKKILDYQEFKNQIFVLPQTNKFYKLVQDELETRILYCRHKLVLYLDLIKNPSGIDALSAYLVFDRLKADNYFEKADISESESLKIDFEAFLPNWTIKTKDNFFIPCIKLLPAGKGLNKSVFEIDIIPVSEIKNKLITYQLPHHKFEPKTRIGNKDIKNRKLFIVLLKDLFQLIDKSITKKDCEIFLCSISELDYTEYSNYEIGNIRNKINKLLMIDYSTKTNEKKPSKLLFCAFLYFLKKNKFITVNRLMEALSEYFFKKVHLSKSTLNNFLYSSKDGLDNYKSFIEDLKNIEEKYVFETKKLKIKKTFLK